MRVIHLDKEKKDAHDPSAEAKELEASIRRDPNEKAFNRLMLLYRKLKEPRKELRTINLAIKTFESRLKDQKPSYNKKVAALSKALRIATGLADQKGNNLYEPGELSKWKRRREMVLKKIRKGAG